MNDEQLQLLMLNKTTISFNHDDDSNLSSLFYIKARSINRIGNQLNKMFNWQDINQAEGKVLDDIGNDYGISRTDNDDDFFRFLLNNARIKNHTDGSVDSLIRLVSVSLQANYDEFHVKAGHENNGENLTISIEDIPNKYNQDARKTKMLMKNLEASIVAGVRLVAVSFQEYNKNELFMQLVNQFIYKENNEMKRRKL